MCRDLTLPNCYRIGLLHTDTSQIGIGINNLAQGGQNVSLANPVALYIKTIDFLEISRYCDAIRG